MQKRTNARLARYVLAMICIGLAGATASSQTPDAEARVQTIANDDYKIGPGDIIDIVVSKNEILSRTGVRISNLGTIQLAMINDDIPAACLSERQLADAIKEKYRKYLVDPSVNVSVREFNSNPVAVIGAVNSPGRFQLQRTIRLVELLTFVNGASPTAGPTAEIIRNARRPYCENTRLVLPAEGDEELISVTLADAFKGGDQANPIVVAGDIVRITTADQTNAFIQGNVKSTLAISLKEPVTLTQALAMAGTTPGAQLEKIKIRRQIAGSVNRDEIAVNVKEINQRKRDDVLLQANDIIDVPGPSGGKKFFQDILKTAAGLPMSVIRY